MSFRGSILVACLVIFVSDAAYSAHLCFPPLFHHKHCQCHAPCGDCEVHVHYCKAPADRPARESAARSEAAQQATYAQILPSTAAYSMPAMMPIMPAMAVYPPQDQRGCGDCERRIERLEDGVRNLSDRMDRIENILESNVKALQVIRDKIQNQDAAES